MQRIDPLLMMFLLLVVLLIWKAIENTSGNTHERKPKALRFVVHCAFGYYGPDRAHPGANRGDLPIKDACRYTRREARDLAAELGAKVEEVPN